MAGEFRRGFDVFKVNQPAEYSRAGKTISIKGHDGTNTSTDSVEANLLFDILNVLKAKK